MKLLTKPFIRSLLRPRIAASHKGDYGHALLIAGSPGMTGAAVIAAKACLRSGVGLLTVNISKEEIPIIQYSIPEAMVMTRQSNEIMLEKYSALGLGPGIGVSKLSVSTVKSIIDSCQLPMVIDADALNILSLNKSWIKKLKPNTVITPHAKEFDRLFGIHENEIDRRQTAIQKAKELGIIIIMKGHETHIISADKIFINTTGNAGLAKGGSGDALTGMITAFLAQGYSAIDAAVIAVYLHGLAADLTLKKQSMESMLISDVIDNLGMAFKSIL